MKKIVPVLLAVGALSVLLTGCPTGSLKNSVDIIALNNQLIDLIRQRDATPPPSADVMASLTSKLADISDTARKEGDAAEAAAKPSAAASLYQIAAIAAWSAGPPTNNRLLSLSDKGISACDKLPGGGAAQSGDCVVLRLGPGLATLDSHADAAERLNDLKRKLKPAELPTAIQTALDTASTLKLVVDQHAAAASLPEDFEKVFQPNLRARFCSLQGLVGLISGSGVDTPTEERVGAAAFSAQEAMRGAGIATTCKLQ
ncbi:MAG TPA: hypothetical protein VMF52_02975 [Steroidobacteraceae bacterium]|nr:hypothetical protein [Steroidobacteraceae bacterium]